MRGVGDQGIGTPDLIDDLRGASDKPLMRSLKIAQTIYLLLGAALAAGCGASSYLMVRCAGISARYTAIMQGEVTQAQQIRVLQVTYKKQVQAWKDILLRGKDDTALAKYDLEFHALAAQVEGECAEMDGRIKDPEARTGLKKMCIRDSKNGCADGKADDGVEGALGEVTTLPGIGAECQTYDDC